MWPDSWRTLRPPAGGVRPRRGALPVVSEALVVLWVQRARWGEHDGGVQVGDDAGHGAGGRDAGLRALVPRLQRRQDQGHLWGARHRQHDDTSSMDLQQQVLSITVYWYANRIYQYTVIGPYGFCKSSK